MADTPNLGLPYIMAAQAQKHVTHNEAIRALDALVHLAVIDRDGTTPPGEPAEGDRHIVGAGSTGAWSGHDFEVAAFQDGGWAFFSPRPGWRAWIVEESALRAWNGNAWIAVGGGGGAGGDGVFDTLGIGATADETNRLALASPAALFNHAGAGHQLKINKSAAGDTASFLFQTSWSGRAELGTAGDDDFHFKVSPDGSAWHEAILIDKDTGEVSFPSGVDIEATDGDMPASTYDPQNIEADAFDRANHTGAQAIGTVTDLQATLDGKAALEPEVNAQTGTSYTLTLADRGGLVTMSNASSNTVTIPANTSVAFPIGTIISIVQLGTGTTTIAGATGVTVNGVTGGTGRIGGRHQAAALLKTAADTWTISGDFGDQAVTTVARTLLAQATQALMRTTGLGFSADGSSLVVAANHAAMRGLLGMTQADVAGLTTDASPQFAALEIGNASDTTLGRSAAGVLNVEGRDLAHTEPGLNAQTGSSYTLALVDKGRIVTMNNASPNTVTIPANSSVAFPLGTIVNIVRIGEGTTTIEGDTGVAANGVPAGAGNIAERWQGAALTKIGTDAWVLSGAIGEVA